MSIPTHNLYEFIHQALENKFHLWYFYPWGQKKLENLIEFFDKNLEKELEDSRSLDRRSLIPNSENLKNYVPTQYHDDINKVRWSCVCIAHDQEPLNFDLYSDENLSTNDKSLVESALLVKIENLGLKHKHPANYIKHWILLHSELNSDQVKNYEKSGEYKCAYWWSHAAISRDWFRFAEYDSSLTTGKKIKKLFLIYSRDCSGTRLYRKTFLESVEKKSILNNCQIGSFYPDSDSADLSAIYNSFDFKRTGISIILETIFDDRIHLTEKTCRALACGHPFLLANGPGCLKYLQKYGFKTFHPWINESYDCEKDADKRLNCIVDEMNRLCNLSQSEINVVLDECNKIANYNKKLFFSDNFFKQIVNELKQNVNNAYVSTQYKVDYKTLWYDYRASKIRNRQKFNKQYTRRYRLFYLTYIRHLKKGGTLENYVPPDLD